MNDDIDQSYYLPDASQYSGNGIGVYEGSNSSPQWNPTMQQTPFYQETYPPASSPFPQSGVSILHDRNVQLDNINCAFFLENQLKNMREELKRLDFCKPSAPTQPSKPHFVMREPKYLSYPLMEYKKNPGWTWLKLMGLGIALFTASLFLIPVTMGALPEVVYYALTMVTMGFAIACFWIAVYQFLTFDKRRRTKFLSSPEYIAQCQEVDRQNALLKANAESQGRAHYEQDLATYNSQKIPEYQQRLAHYNSVVLPAWQDERNALQESINATEATLQEAYALNIIPGKYRNLSAVTFISGYMGTSQFDLGTTLQRLDHDVEIKIAQEHLEVAVAQLAVANEMLSQQYISNYLQSEILAISQQGTELLRSSHNWQRANAALQAYEVYKQRRNGIG